MVISAPKWKFRNTEEDVDPWERYGNNEALFSIKIHYAGKFTTQPGRKYVNGDFSFFDDVDIDEFSVLEVIDMVEMVGYSENVKSNYHFKIPDGDLDTGLHALGNDHDVRKLCEYVKHGNKLIEVYIEQENTRKVVKGSCAKKLLLGCQDEVDVGQSSHHGESSHPVTESMGQPSAFANDFYSASDLFLGVDFDPFYGLSDNEDGQDDGNDSVVLVDVENTVDDVIVNMDNFDKTNAKIMGEKEPPNPSECIANEEREVALHVVDNDEFESASDEDEMEKLRQRKLKHLRKQNKSKDSGVHKYHFYVGQQFGSADEVKQRVHLHSIETRRELYFKKNDKLRVRAQCRGTIPQFHDEGDGPFKVVGPSEANEPNKKQPWTKSKVSESRGHEYSPRSQAKVVGGKPKLRKFADNECTWALQVSKLPNSQTWQVKCYDDKHRCLQARKIKYCTTNFLAEGIQDQIEKNPKIPIKAIQDQLQKKYQLEVSGMKAFRAKTKAQDQVRGDFNSQYTQLRNYVLELKQCNPNTTVRIAVESEADHTCPTRKFKRIYVCLGAAKEGFKACMRQFLGFDGTFIRGPYPGQLLTAVGVDPNNGIYPLAYGIVEAETKDSWTWFLEILKEDLDLQNNSNFTFISDRQKGIIPAIEQLFPVAEHRFCLRHIHQNMKLKWNGTSFKDLLWKCATALTVPQFDAAMTELKTFNKDCHEWLCKIPPKHWARAHFSGRAKTDMLLNDICEVFNAKLLDGRERPIINTLEYVRDYMLKRIVIVKEVIEKSPGPLTPTATKLFQSIKDQANEYTEQWNGGNLYRVTGPWGSQHVVDIVHRTCSCRKWELTGIPCKHVVATIWNMAANRVEVGLPETWVHPCYRLDTWRTVYSHLINPIHSKILWPKSDIPTTIIPPNYHPHIGRPPKKRKMSLGESIPLVHDGKLSRKGKTVTCVLCKGKGHNKRTCTGLRNVASGSTNVGNKKRKSTNGPSGSTTVGNKKSKSTNAPSGSNVAANKTQASANVQPSCKRSSNAATPSVPATKKKIPTKRKSATQPTAKASKLY